MKNPTDRLDQADHDPLPAELDVLNALRVVPTPNPKMQREARQAFLAQANRVLHPVAVNRKIRHVINFPNIKKEFFAMPRILQVVMVVVLGILMTLGSVSATAFAAQDSLPTGPLYGLKIVTEDTRISLASKSESAIGLLTEFAARRVNEMAQLAAAHLPISLEVLARLDKHLNLALFMSAGLEEPQASLEQILQMTETQSITLAQARSMSPNDPILEQAGQHLEIVRSLAESGLMDPGQFRILMLGQNAPSAMPSNMPTRMPTRMPTMMPTMMPSAMPTMMPTSMPTMMPSAMPTMMPTMMPTSMPTMMPSAMPTMMPTSMPTMMPTSMPTMMPSAMPGSGGGIPTMMPTGMPGGGGGGGMMP
jgi:hypothetical protein